MTVVADNQDIRPSVYQEGVLDFIENETGNAVVSAKAGSGKAQPLDAAILTPTGWSTVGEMQIGSQVVTPKGTTANVIGVFPQGKKDIYLVTFVDGRSTECCNDHLWKVNCWQWRFQGFWDKTSKVWEIGPSIYDGYRVVPLSDVRRFHSQPTKTLSIPLLTEVCGSPINLPIDPYVLGVLLGDGGFSGYSVTLSSTDIEIVNIIKTKLLPGYELRQQGDTIDYRIVNENVYRQPNTHHYALTLREVGLMGHKANTKFVPEIYKSGSHEQRLQLIRGLMDTDGTVGKKGGVSFTTTSYQLALDLQYLIRSIGGVAKIAPRQRSYTYKGIKRVGLPSYDVSIRYKNPRDLFILTRKQNRLSENYQYADSLRLTIQSIEFVGIKEAQCILIDDPDHLYITNDFIVTHNTSTLKMISRHRKVVNKSSLFLAFNTHIAAELQKKLPSTVKAATLHSTGRRAVQAAIRPRLIVDDDKYTIILQNLLPSSVFEGEDGSELMGALKKLLNLAQHNLINPRDFEALENLMLHFDINIAMDTYEIALTINEAMERGKAQARQGLISFTDMIWLPEVWNLSPIKYDWVLVDESQDLTPAQLALALRCMRPGGRMIAVGDPQQAIYGFTGADAKSIDNIIEKTNAKVLPLSICYRCPRSHVELAKAIVPDIEAAPGAIEGVVETITDEQIVERVRVGDLILCRTTAPLMELVFDLIGQGIAAKVRGTDIGKGLVTLLNKIAKRSDFNVNEMIRSIDEYRRRQVELLKQKSGDQNVAIQRIEDKCASLVAIYSRSEPSSLDGFRKAITDIFTDGKPAVMLSTIHKAKGLEEKRVFLLRPELMPHPMAKRDWEQEQEMNLRYVALTRAKEELYFVQHTGRYGR